MLAVTKTAINQLHIQLEFGERDKCLEDSEENESNEETRKGEGKDEDEEEKGDDKEKEADPIWKSLTEALAKVPVDTLRLEVAPISFQASQ